MANLDISPFKKLVRMDLVPQYNFYVDFTGTVASLIQTATNYISKYPNDKNIFPYLSELLNELSKDSIGLSFQVKRAVLPDIMITGSDEELGGMKVNMLTSASIGAANNLQIETHVATNNLMYKLYYLWINIMMDLKTNARRPRKTYEAPIKIFIYDRLGVTVQERTYNGCSPRSTNDLNFDSESTTYLASQTFTFKINNGMEINLI